MNILRKNKPHSFSISEIIDSESVVTSILKRSCFWKPFGSQRVKLRNHCSIHHFIMCQILSLTLRLKVFGFAIFGVLARHPNLSLTLSWRRPLSYRKQSIDLLCKSMDWFLYDNGLRHERVKYIYFKNMPYHILYGFWGLITWYCWK